MRQIFVWLSVLALLFSCATSSPPLSSAYPNAGYTDHKMSSTKAQVVPVWVDKRFTKKHHADIAAALGQWNIVLNGVERFVVVSDEFDMEGETLEIVDATGEGLVILRRDKSDPIVALLPKGTLGWAFATVGEETHVLNLLEELIANRDMVGIAMHEVGHSLGLPDVQVKHTLMFPEYKDGIRCADVFTIQMLATLRGWDWTTLNWCGYPI